MRTVERMPTEHADVIHDVAYDFYGERLATCSSDMMVKVYERGRLVASWKAHDGSIWRLAWAHPEFGQVLASCSFDRMVHIWEEPHPRGGARGAAWTKSAVLPDARESVSDVAFAPRHLGLQLGSLAADGKLRVHEALDVMNLGHWSLVDELDLPKALCFAWGQCPGSPAAVLVGFADNKAAVWARHDGTRQWREVASIGDHREAVHSVAWAPHVGRASQLLATGSRDGSVQVHSLRMPSGSGAAGGWEASIVARLTDHGQQVWRVEWNVTGTLLASSGDDGTVRVWQPDWTGHWRCISVVKSDGATMDFA